MKFNSFVAAYSPDSENNINNHNYYMNGDIMEFFSGDSYEDMCETKAMRNLFALADGSKCDQNKGGDAAFLCIQKLNNVLDSNFQNAYTEYFKEANTAVSTFSFNEGGVKMDVDVGVVFLYREWFKVYNFGNISIFYKNAKGIKKISGTPPEFVTVRELQKKEDENEENIENEEFEVIETQKKNTPHIGYILEDLMVEPYVSEQLKLVGKNYIIMTTESVMSVINEDEILNILNDNTILFEDKAASIVKLAAERNPSESYTVQVISKKQYRPIYKLKMGILAGILAALVGVLAVSFSPMLDNVGSVIRQELIRRMHVLDNRPDLSPWTTIKYRDDEKVPLIIQETESNVGQTTVQQPVVAPKPQQQETSTPTPDTEVEDPKEEDEEDNTLSPVDETPVDTVGSSVEATPEEDISQIIQSW